jgi:23S rRNA pseudouridine1911/1915/1917 synthase
MEKIIIQFDDRINFQRFDHFLTDKFPSLGRSLLKKLFENNSIQGFKIHPSGLKEPLKLVWSKMPPEGTLITVLVEPVQNHLMPAAENIKLNILYEDEHLLFLIKPAGMVTHPGAGNFSGTLVNALLHHVPQLKEIHGPARPGIVHRLDKGTSGVMVVAKTLECHRRLVGLFSVRNIERFYEAILFKTIKTPKNQNVSLEKIKSKSGRLEGALIRHPQNRLKFTINEAKGKKAITHFKILKEDRDLSYVQFKLETGRTHQIRVHASMLLKSPVLLDGIYGSKPNHLEFLKRKIPDFNFENLMPEFERKFDAFFLHAKVLGFIHPITQLPLRFECEVPDYFKTIINAIEP